jgi:calmodulin
MDADAALRAATSAFLAYDCGQKGHLLRHELRAAHVALFGWKISSLELDSLLPKRAEAGTLGLELPEFCSAMVSRLLAQDPDDVVRRQFRALDTECKGFLSQADLEQAVADVAPHLPHATTRLVFSQIDSDGDGRVSYADFYAMMTAPPAAAPDAALQGRGRFRRSLHTSARAC